MKLFEGPLTTAQSWVEAMTSHKYASHTKQQVEYFIDEVSMFIGTSESEFQAFLSDGRQPSESELQAFDLNLNQQYMEKFSPTWRDLKMQSNIFLQGGEASTPDKSDIIDESRLFGKKKSPLEANAASSSGAPPLTKCKGAASKVPRGKGKAKAKGKASKSADKVSKKPAKRLPAKRQASDDSSSEKKPAKRLPAKRQASDDSSSEGPSGSIENGAGIE
eukprot:9472574-Pyramimonas_sp.AAC.2